MSGPLAEGQYDEIFAALERRTYNTYKARLNATNRLASRGRSWSLSLICCSMSTTVASVALLADRTIYGKAGPVLLLIVSIATLVTSLASANMNYAARSRDMFVSYRKVQRLSAEVERLNLGSSTDRTLETITALHARYDAILDETENHNSYDFLRSGEMHATLSNSSNFWAKLRRKVPSFLGERFWSVLPFLTLLFPLVIFIPLVRWMLS